MLKAVVFIHGRHGDASKFLQLVFAAKQGGSCGNFLWGAGDETSISFDTNVWNPKCHWSSLKPPAVGHGQLLARVNIAALSTKALGWNDPSLPVCVQGHALFF